MRNCPMTNGSTDFDALLSEFDQDGLALLTPDERREFDRLTTGPSEGEILDSLPLPVRVLMLAALRAQTIPPRGAPRDLNAEVALDDLDINVSLKSQIGTAFQAGRWDGPIPEVPSP